MQVLFFLNAAVLSRKILVKAKYRIGTWYRQILNIKGLGSGSGYKTPDQDIPNNNRECIFVCIINTNKQYFLV